MIDERFFQEEERHHDHRIPWWPGMALGIAILGGLALIAWVAS